MKCCACPKKCNIDRNITAGACHVGADFVVCRVGLHMWEEPPISGSAGSGTIFFAGCNLSCRFCQNYNISRTGAGVTVTSDDLVAIMLRLQSMGAANINLVSPAQYAVQLAPVLARAKPHLHIPIVYNTNAYELPETLQLLDGLVDVYLPDIKFYSPELSQNLTGAADYFAVATAALAEMKRQQPTDIFDGDLMKSGVIIRHLALPNCTEDSKKILDYVAARYLDSYVSLMSQYFVARNDDKFPFLNRKLTQREYDSVVDYFCNVGLTNGYTQELSSATIDYLPEFNPHEVQQFIDEIHRNH
jgi:putative pyruvate formate lyase activating enzyme